MAAQSVLKTFSGFPLSSPKDLEDWGRWVKGVRSRARAVARDPLRFDVEEASCASADLFLAHMDVLAFSDIRGLAPIDEARASLPAFSPETRGETGGRTTWLELAAASTSSFPVPELDGPGADGLATVTLDSETGSHVLSVTNRYGRHVPLDDPPEELDPFVATLAEHGLSLGPALDKGVTAVREAAQRTEAASAEARQASQEALPEGA